MAAFFLLIDFKKPVTPTVSPPTPPTATATPTPMPTCTDTERDDAALTLLGLDRSSARVGSQVRWSLVPKGDAYDAFVASGARTPKSLAVALENPHLAYFLGQQLSPTQASALDASDFVAVQPLQSLVLKGNHAVVNGKVVQKTSVSRVGEVFWVYVDPKSCSPAGVMVRVICANGVVVRKDLVAIRE